MSVQTSGEGVVLVDLGQGVDLAEELQNVTQLVDERAGCDVIMDFSQVTLLGSSQLASLLRLRKLVQGHGHRLVLCNVGRLAMGIFSVTGLDAVFEMAADPAAAAATVQAPVQV
jgi:anti-anti-sigma factor